jgi:hypothetical protein
MSCRFPGRPRSGTAGRARRSPRRDSMRFQQPLASARRSSGWSSLGQWLRNSISRTPGARRRPETPRHSRVRSLVTRRQILGSTIAQIVVAMAEQGSVTSAQRASISPYLLETIEYSQRNRGAFPKPGPRESNILSHARLQAWRRPSSVRRTSYRKSSPRTVIQRSAWAASAVEA